MAPPRALRKVSVTDAVTGYERWLLHRLTHDAVQQTTVTNYLADIDTFTDLVGPDTILDDITAERIQAVLGDLAVTTDRRYTATAPPRRRRSRASLARFAVSVRGMFTWAASQGYLTVNPWPDVVAPTFPTRTPDHRRGVDTPTAVALRNARTAPDSPANAAADLLLLRDRLILRLLTETGPRVSEVCALNRQDVQRYLAPDGGELAELVVRQGKGSKRRILPLSPTLHELIDRYLALRRPTPTGLTAVAAKDAARALVVSRTGRRLYPRDVQRMVDRYARTLDVHVTPHGLRHTALTALAHAGVTPASIAEIAGHASLSTTSVYIDPDPAAAAAALRASPLASP